MITINDLFNFYFGLAVDPKAEPKEPEDEPAEDTDAEVPDVREDEVPE